MSIIDPSRDCWIIGLLGSGNPTIQDSVIQKSINPIIHFMNNNQQYFERWTRVERYQHWILAISFIILVITGFALKYPEAAWVQPILLLEGELALRGWIHHIAAVVMVTLSFYHIGYTAFTPRGRFLLKAFAPTRQDWADLKDNFRFLLGKRGSSPEFDHFSYTEKAEYWALVWGHRGNGLLPAKISRGGVQFHARRFFDL